MGHILRTKKQRCQDNALQVTSVFLKMEAGIKVVMVPLGKEYETIAEKQQCTGTILQRTTSLVNVESLS